MTYTERMAAAISRAQSDYPIIGWYGATESAADAFSVSLPELQRALEPMLIASES